MKTISTKSGLLAGGIALALLAAGTTGAVASQLIGSEDIAKNAIHTRHLDSGSVTWGKTFSDKTKAKIIALAGQDGAPGPAGATGPQGPRGLTGYEGPQGRAGHDGDASMVGYAAYGGEWGQQAQDGPFWEVTQQDGDPIVLDDPGTYLVTSQAVFSPQSYNNTMYGALAFFGDFSASNEYDLLSQSGLCFGFLVPFCESTETIHVGQGEVVRLPMYAGGACSSDSTSCEVPDGPPPVGTVTVYKMTDETVDTSTYDQLLQDLYNTPAIDPGQLRSYQQRWGKDPRSLYTQ